MPVAYRADASEAAAGRVVWDPGSKQWKKPEEVTIPRPAQERRHLVDIIEIGPDLLFVGTDGLIMIEIRKRGRLVLCVQSLSKEFRRIWKDGLDDLFIAIGPKDVIDMDVLRVASVVANNPSIAKGYSRMLEGKPATRIHINGVGSVQRLNKMSLVLEDLTGVHVASLKIEKGPKESPNSPSLSTFVLPAILPEAAEGFGSALRHPDIKTILANLMHLQAKEI